MRRVRVGSLDGMVGLGGGGEGGGGGAGAGVVEGGSEG